MPRSVLKASAIRGQSRRAPVPPLIQSALGLLKRLATTDREQGPKHRAELCIPWRQASATGLKTSHMAGSGAPTTIDIGKVRRREYSIIGDRDAIAR